MTTKTKSEAQFKALQDKKKEAITNEMYYALSLEQINIINELIEEDFERHGDDLTIETILGTYRFAVTLVCPHADTEKYISPHLARYREENFG